MSDRPDELRHQLTTLWRAARTGINTMKEVVVRSSQVGLLRWDIALSHREREQLLQQIGARLVEHLDAGGAGGDLPEEIVTLRERLREVEGRLRSDTVRASDNAFGARRGFEPEAAVDYGDEPVVEDTPSTKRRVKPAARGTKTSKRTAGRNGGSRK